MIRPQGGAAVASACRMRSMTTGVARPGTKAVSSDQASPAKIEGITGCFSIISTAPPSLPSRRPCVPPCGRDLHQERRKRQQDQRVELMIISSGTSPASPKA